MLLADSTAAIVDACAILAVIALYLILGALHNITMELRRLDPPARELRAVPGEDR